MMGRLAISLCSQKAKIENILTEDYDGIISTI